MPRTIEIERPDTGIPTEAIQLVDPEIRVDLEPTVEVLGKLRELSWQKTGGMDAQRRPMSG